MITPLDKNGRPVTVSTPIADYTNEQLEESIANSSEYMLRRKDGSSPTTLTRYVQASLIAMCNELDSRQA